MDPIGRFKINLNYKKGSKSSSRPSSGNYPRLASYSSRNHDQKNQQVQRSKSSSCKSQKSDTLTLNSPLDKKIFRSVKILSGGNSNYVVDSIRESGKNALDYYMKETRIELSKTLFNLHPFFQKIEKPICESIVLLGKLTTYIKGEIIYSDIDEAEKLRTKNDLGFVLYGKLQLFNDKNFYSKIVKNFNTLFEQKYIREGKINDYNARVMEETMVLWLPRSSYYTIRKECFLKMDLKYKFHEFENLLKYYFIHKKTVNEND